MGIHRSILVFLFCFLFFEVLQAQTNIVDSMAHQTFQRKFLVHTPPGFSNTSPVPLVVFLHGGGGNMASAQGFTNFNAVSNANGFLLVYPQGIGIIPSGGYSWADGRGTSADLAGVDDLGFIDKLLDTLLARYSIDTNKIYLCGFSNGGFMTQRFACQQNQRFAAMASLGSIMDTASFARCTPQRPIPMLLMLGTEDPFVPFTGGSMIGSGQVPPIVGIDSLVNFWKSNNRCLSTNVPFNMPDLNRMDSSTVTLFQFSNCPCNALVSFYRINGGGHTWPGVEIPSYERIAGQTNEDIQAGAELWNFFRTKTLCRTSVSVQANEAQTVFELYPNPAKSFIQIQMQDKTPFQVTIINSLAQVMIEVANQRQINIAALKKGIYCLSVEQRREVSRKFFVKE